MCDISTQLVLSMSSGVAHQRNQMTGTHKQSASIVPIQKLSLAMLINHLACSMIAIFSWTLSMRHTKMIVGHAIFFAYTISGQSPMTISGVLV